MNRPSKTFLIGLAIIASGAAGLIAGRFLWPAPMRTPESSTTTSRTQPSQSAATGPVIYSRDPDGRPAYSLTPKKTPAGKAYLPVHAGEDVSFEDAPPAAPTASGEPKRIRFYRNPMGLPDTSPTPKKDPMGMDYIPVYEEDTGQESTVRVSLDKLQRTGVRSEPVERRTFNIPVRAAGTIQFDERRISIVSLRFEGFIESVDVATGDHVRKGQTLMRIYGPSLSNTAAEYLTVLNAHRDGVLSSERIKGAKQRLENLGMPESAIAAIARTRQIPHSIAWPAPQDGHVLERAASSGMRAAPGDMLFRIADHSVVWVLADIPERDVSLIAPQQQVSVRARAFPDRTFTGQVALIYPHMNMETRTVRVRIELPNPDGLLRGDMYADVEIASGSSALVLTVPESAVIDTGKRQVVILDKGEGRFEPREVKSGRRGEGLVEIKNGVSENDRVVTTANFLIDAESNLKAALQGLGQAEDRK
ncbi:MAG TPA: efflux RND transporter periplasmic adaptor subunit [Hyphomicrobium sp.]